MLFWIIAGVMAVGCALVLGLFGLRGRADDASAQSYDLQVYRDQLKEVERDLARGVIAPEDAERVRTEVSRRILAADTDMRAHVAQSGVQPLALRAFVMIGAVGVVAGATLLYGQMGTPGYAGLPQKARIAASDAARADRLSQAQIEAQLSAPQIDPNVPNEYMALVTRLRDTVAARPDDLRGFELLARSEASIGNLPAAHVAQTQVVALKGDAATASDFAELADMLVSAANGYVSDDAEQAVRGALERDAREPRARYYMGLYLMQVDRPDMAFRTWDALLRDSTDDAPWVPLIRGQMEELAWRAGVARYQLPQTGAPRGPSVNDIAVAEDMSPEERAQMIRGMVEGLAGRIEEEGGTPGEWARLINAYAVLGDDAAVRATLAQARVVFADEPLTIEIVENAAKEAGFSE